MRVVENVKAHLAQNDPSKAFDALIKGIGDEHAFTHLNGLARLYTRLPKDQLGLHPLKLAIVGNSTTDHLLPVLRLLLAREGFDAEIYCAEFGTLDQSLLDPGSQLYQFAPDIIWLFTGYRDIPFQLAAGATPDAVQTAMEDALDVAESRWHLIRENSNAFIVQNNADLPLSRPLGNLDGNVSWGRIGFLRRYNLALADAASAGVTVFDLDYLSASFGKTGWFDDRFWYHSKHAFSVNATGQVGHSGARLIAAIKGRAKKCVVVDLDNTLWGGVIGDDGSQSIKIGAGTVEGEAFAEFQSYLLALKERGVILAVCSKNDHDIARTAFTESPGMVLQYEDFAMFVANWSNKADNIKSIAESLEIGLDSMVFVDDNPVERDLVRTMLPMVAVPELTADPSQYLRILDRECYADQVAFTDEDSRRTDSYRANMSRKESRIQFTNLDEFLKHLEMTAAVGEFDDSNLPRIAQLINKSNQFHLTTTRYSEAQVRAMIADDSKTCRYFRLTDRHGDNGLISVLILDDQNDEELVIDTWVMSCRVLARGMEEFICNELVSLTKAKNRSRLIGRYLPTEKNGLVADLYERLGFEKLADEEGQTTWQLTVTESTQPAQSFIRRVDADDASTVTPHPNHSGGEVETGQLEQQN